MSHEVSDGLASPMCAAFAKKSLMERTISSTAIHLPYSEEPFLNHEMR